jgi:hypothetical protein
MPSKSLSNRLIGLKSGSDRPMDPDVLEERLPELPIPDPDRGSDQRVVRLAKRPPAAASTRAWLKGTSSAKKTGGFSAARSIAASSAAPIVVENGRPSKPRGGGRFSSISPGT